MLLKIEGVAGIIPKFTLVEIQRMANSIEGLEILNNIISNRQSIVYKYYIHVKGDFDEPSHEEFINSEEFSEDMKDTTLYFRSCSFVKEGFGCTLPVSFRTNVCNFFICDELIEEASNHKEFKKYLKERDSYSNFINWENQCLENILFEKEINLKDNFNEVIMLLKLTSITEYEFPRLDDIEF